MYFSVWNVNIILFYANLLGFYIDSRFHLLQGVNKLKENFFLVVRVSASRECVSISELPFGGLACRHRRILSVVRMNGTGAADI